MINKILNLEDHMIYLDNAATTLKKPKQVLEAVLTAMQTIGNAGRGVHGASLGAARTVFDTRKKVSDFFHAEGPSQVAFTCNSTEALNIALKGILNPGDHVITSVLEHNSVLRPLYELEDRGVELTILPCRTDGTLDYDSFAAAVRPNTRMIVSTHGSNLTGNLVDLGRLGRIARKHGLLFVADVSQTAGVFPIDMQKMQIDVLCFTGHKGMMGPQGTGGICVRKGLTIRPLKTGGSGIQTYHRSHPKEMPAALEAGTLNGHGIAGLDAAIDYLNTVGLAAIHRKEQALMRRFYDGVKELPGIRIYGDFQAEERCAIVALNLRDWSSAEVSDVLNTDYGICTRAGGHCAPLMHEALGTAAQGAVRFSFSYMNTQEEADAAVDALRELTMELIH
jgi:cysteine desulfurase family protein